MIEIDDAEAASLELARLGLPVHEPPRALPGGVSNRVFRAATIDGDVVLKQSVERLMVAEEWIAPRSRIYAEAAAMGIFHGLAPERAPQLLAADPNHFVIVMSAAPADWTDWKFRLRRGEVNPELGKAIGQQLGLWHAATSNVVLPPTLTDTERLSDLRLSPYFGATAARRPELTEELGAVSSMLLSRRECLVHGDFSPKNILTNGEAFWITDFEVAHLGDPRFDVGFLLSHLLLKAEADPASREDLETTAAEFLAGYDIRSDRPLTGDADLASITAALIAARVDGKSPVDYLSERHQDVLRKKTSQWLKDPGSFWSGLKE